MRDEISNEQGKLRADAEIVRRYGESHPESWVDLRYENEPTVRLVARFSGDDLALHRDALRHLVSYPDQLEVESSPWPGTRLEEIRRDVTALARGSEIGLFSGWGTMNGKVNVTLRADGVRVAERLADRYGDAIDVTVGFLHFPDCAFRRGRPPPFTDATRPALPPLPDDVEVVATEELRVRSGQNLRSAIRVRNEGPVEMVINTNGQLTASVVNPQNHEIVGVYSGAQTLPLIPFHARPGQSVEIPLLIGTASTVPELGYAVPPAEWAIEVVLPLADSRVLRAPLIRLAVVS